MEINKLIEEMLTNMAGPISPAKIEFLTSFFDKISDGIIITNDDGTIILYNKALEELEFRSRDNMLGRFIWEASE